MCVCGGGDIQDKIVFRVTGRKLDSLWDYKRQSLGLLTKGRIVLAVIEDYGYSSGLLPGTGLME